MHFMRNLLARVPKGSAFAQPDAGHVRSQLDEVTRMLEFDVATCAGKLRLMFRESGGVTRGPGLRPAFDLDL